MPTKVLLSRHEFLGQLDGYRTTLRVPTSFVVKGLVEVSKPDRTENEFTSRAYH